MKKREKTIKIGLSLVMACLIIDKMKQCLNDIYAEGFVDGANFVADKNVIK